MSWAELFISWLTLTLGFKAKIEGAISSLGKGLKRFFKNTVWSFKEKNYNYSSHKVGNKNMVPVVQKPISNKGAVTMRNFLGNLSRNAVAMKVAEKITALSHCAIFSSNLQHFGPTVSWEAESGWRISENAHALTANVTRKLQQK